MVDLAVHRSGRDLVTLRGTESYNRELGTLPTNGHGFRVVETRTHPIYERYTGIEGRHRMVKQLD